MAEPAVPLCEIWRGDVLESLHLGHVVVSDGRDVVFSMGDPKLLFLPRSSIKILQALPLITSGAAREYKLDARHLALASASHDAAAVHTETVHDWLKGIGFGESDLRCGAQMPRDKAARDGLRHKECPPDQTHNNCSGKHSGFLTLAKHLQAKSALDYIDPEHPVQVAAREAMEDICDYQSPCFGIDGCSAPNHAFPIENIAHAMARFAQSEKRNDVTGRAAWTLVEAIRAHPVLLAGDTRACTKFINATQGEAIVKTGAEGVFTAILPRLGLGIALKIQDGATRAAEIAIGALLIKYGVLDQSHPVVKTLVTPDISNWRGVRTGFMRPAF